MDYSNYGYSSFHIRGPHEYIELILTNLKNKNVDIGYYYIESKKKVSDKITEIVISYSDKLHNLIERYPYVKAIGFVEVWNESAGYLAFSDVGKKDLKLEFIDYFDRHNDDRWTCNNPTTDFHAEELFISCGETNSVYYKFDLKEEWEKNNYNFEAYE